jgi:hypothetical protein
VSHVPPHLRTRLATLGLLLGGGVAAAALGLASATVLSMRSGDGGTPAAPQQLMWKAAEIVALERETGGWPSGLARQHGRFGG